MKIRWFKSQKNDQNRDSIEGWIQEVHGKNISFNLNCVEIELLALGSSHGAYGFNPLLFSDLFAFSLCSASQDLYYSKMLLSRCIDRMPKCNTVILFYSVFSPGFDLQMTNEKYRCNIYSKYWSIPPQSSDFIINGDKKQVVLPIKIAANVAKNFPRGYDKPVLFYNSDPIEDRVLAHLKHNARENSQNIHLKEMAVDLSSSGIRFVVIIAPVRQDYIKCLQKISSKNNSLDLY